MRFNAQGDSSQPSWLVTYADLMTLLVAFFVLQISFSDVNWHDGRFEGVRDQLRREFGGAMPGNQDTNAASNRAAYSVSALAPLGPAANEANASATQRLAAWNVSGPQTLSPDQLRALQTLAAAWIHTPGDWEIRALLPDAVATSNDSNPWTQALAVCSAARAELAQAGLPQDRVRVALQPAFSPSSALAARGLRLELYFHPQTTRESGGLAPESNLRLSDRRTPEARR